MVSMMDFTLLVMGLSKLLVLGVMSGLALALSDVFCLFLSLVIASVIFFLLRISLLWSDMKLTVTRLDWAISSLLFKLWSLGLSLMFLDSVICLLRGSLGNLPRTFIS